MLVPSSSFQTQLTGKDFAIDIHLTYKLRFVDQQLLTYNIFFPKAMRLYEKNNNNNNKNNWKPSPTMPRHIGEFYVTTALHTAAEPAVHAAVKK